MLVVLVLVVLVVLVLVIVLIDDGCVDWLFEDSGCYKVWCEIVAANAKVDSSFFRGGRLRNNRADTAH